MAIDYPPQKYPYPPQMYPRAAVVARVKAAFLEGYDAMRHQFNLGDFAEDAWEASASKRLLDEPKKIDAVAEQIATLTALADMMRKGFHGNLVDVPVSPKLDEWVDELDRIISTLRTP